MDPVPKPRPKSRRRAAPPPPPPTGSLKDPLTAASIVAMVVIGIVVMVDIVQDGDINPNLLALFLAVFGPLVPALILRSRSRNGKEN